MTGREKKGIIYLVGSKQKYKKHNISKPERNLKDRLFQKLLFPDQTKTQIHDLPEAAALTSKEYKLCTQICLVTD